MENRLSLKGLATIGALSVGVLVASPPTQAEAQDLQTRDGVIEAVRTANVSTSIESIVTDILFLPGSNVIKGQALFILDDTKFRIEVETARSNVIRAELTKNSARQDLDRALKLKERGAITDVALFKTQAADTLAGAVLAKTRADLRAAQIDLEQAVVRAPIDGVISAPNVALGSYVKTGSNPLASIVQLDPVRLTYKIPYIDRVEELGITDMTLPLTLLERIELTIMVSDTWEHPYKTNPGQVSADVDPETGELTVWAEVQNPDAMLRPGLQVKVLPAFVTD